MDFPGEGMSLTHILVVSGIERSKAFYAGVLGAQVFREYGGTSCVLAFLDSWLLDDAGSPGRDLYDAPGRRDRYH